MTTEENKLLSELKDFFNSKYAEGWKVKFQNYTSKLVSDGHLDQSIIDEFLEYEEPNDIVKRFNAFRNIRPTPIQTPIQTPPPGRPITRPTRPTRSTTYDGCGSSSRQTDGCGYVSRPSRSVSDGCGSSSRGSSRSSC